MSTKTASRISQEILEDAFNVQLPPNKDRLQLDEPADLALL